MSITDAAPSRQPQVRVGDVVSVSRSSIHDLVDSIRAEVVAVSHTARGELEVRLVSPPELCGFDGGLVLLAVWRPGWGEHLVEHRSAPLARGGRHYAFGA